MSERLRDPVGGPKGGRSEVPAYDSSERPKLQSSRDLSFALDRHGGCVVLRVEGEVDVSNAAALGTNLRQLVETDHVVVDLTGVSFMDSSGVSALIAATKHAANSGTSLRVAGATRAVMRTLQIVGVDTYLGHEESVADAIAATQTKREAESPPPTAPTRGEAEVSPT
jgi:anti-anti-sigma factor